MTDNDKVELLASKVSVYKIDLNEAAIANVRKALAKWEAGYRLDLSGADVADLLEAYDQIKAVLK